MDLLSLLLFRLLELLSKVAHGNKDSVEPKLRRAWWWKGAKNGWCRCPIGSERWISIILMIATRISYQVGLQAQNAAHKVVECFRNATGKSTTLAGSRYGLWVTMHKALAFFSHSDHPKIISDFRLTT